MSIVGTDFLRHRLLSAAKLAAVACVSSASVSFAQELLDFDPLDRLEKQVNSGSIVSFDFDAAGNRTNRVIFVPFSLLSIPPQSAFAGIASTPIPLRLSGSSSLESLTFSARSSNRSLFQEGGFLFSGTGANRSLVVTPVPGQAGTTCLKVIASDGTVAVATTFELTVLPVVVGFPVVSTQPHSVEAVEGDRVQFTAEATGQSPVAYQWQFEDADLTGQMFPTLILPSVSLAQAGRYRLRISNPVGTNWSQYATLAVARITDPSLAYASDFASPVGTEWSNRRTAVAPDTGRTLLGQFGAEAVTLALSNLPAHAAVELLFDLAVINSWDGAATGTDGPDIWTLGHSSDQVLLRTTFSAGNAGPDDTQNFPSFAGERTWPANTGSQARNVLGFPHNGQPGSDATYHLRHVFAHTNQTLTVSFDGTGLKSANGELPQLTDESWALDKVRVRLVFVPQPVLYQTPLGSVLRLSWPDDGEPWELATVDSLSISEWKPATETVVTHGRELSALIVPSAGSRFFRLHPAESPELQPSEPPALLLKTNLSVVPSSAVALGDDANFYCVTSSGLGAYRSDILSAVWKKDSNERCVPSGYPVSITAGGQLLSVGDGNVCGNGPLFVTDTKSDSTLQRHDFFPEMHPRHVVAIDDVRQRAYFGTRPFIAFEAGTFSPAFTSFSGEDIGERGLLLDAQGNAYLGSFHAYSYPTRLASFSPAGALRWTRNIIVDGGDGPGFVAAIGSEIVLLYYPLLNQLLALDATTGASLWEANDLDNPVVDGAANLYANAVLSAQIVSLTRTGNERWRTTLPDTTEARVDFIDSEGRIVARGGNRLFALSARTGGILWQFTADKALTLPAVLATGGRLHLVDANGQGYLLNTSYDYSASDWPVARYANRRHTMKAGDRLPQPVAH